MDSFSVYLNFMLTLNVRETVMKVVRLLLAVTQRRADCHLLLVARGSSGNDTELRGRRGRERA